MGTKNQPGKFDCYANAASDEPMFILLARDPHAPAAVERWATDREALIDGGRKPESDRPMVAEARQCAAAMRAWRQANRPDPVTPAPAPPPPVDRTQRTLADGKPVTDDHRELKPNGQQKDYVVLSAEERAKGFVRPVRTAYVHQTCGTLTTMSRAIAETYARDPAFYSGTFCCGCGAHFPVGESGEFIWDDGSRAKVGT